MKKITGIKSFKKLYLSVSVLSICFSQSLFASGTDMPWEGPLEKLLDSFTGPVAKTVAILALVAVGGMMAFGEMGSAMKRMLNIVLGISIVFAAATWGLSFFNFTGGVNF